MKKNNKKGFTLAELLIVVAIIAVLVAVAIPVFTSQLEKSKVSADAANIRACYAEAMANSLIADGASTTATTKFKAQTAGDKFATYNVELPLGATSTAMTVGSMYTVTYAGSGSWSVTAASGS